MTAFNPKEFKIVALRECPTPEVMQVCDTPEAAAAYWRMNVSTSVQFDPERECFVVLVLNTRRRVKGHHMASIGTLDTLLVDPRSVFRAAVIAGVAAVVLMHNHPSEEAQPSEADIKVTRHLIRAGQLLKIDVLDHVIVGDPNHCSFATTGTCFTNRVDRNQPQPFWLGFSCLVSVPSQVQMEFNDVNPIAPDNYETTDGRFKSKMSI